MNKKLEYGIFPEWLKYLIILISILFLIGWGGVYYLENIFLNNLEEIYSSIPGKSISKQFYLIYTILSICFVAGTILFSFTAIKILQHLYKFKEELNFFRCILNHIPFSIFYKDLNGKYIYTNSTFLKNFGGLKKNLFGLHTRDIYESIKADHTEVDAHIISDIRVLRTMKPQIFLIDDSENNKYAIYKAPYKDCKGDISGIFGIGIKKNCIDNIIKDTKKINEEK